MYLNFENDDVQFRDYANSNVGSSGLSPNGEFNLQTEQEFLQYA